jgi:cardiolipin synthase A/B
MESVYWIILSSMVLVASITAGHALLYKRDPRAALGWIGVCLIFPLAGPFLYFLFGINRVRTRAKKLRTGFIFSMRVGYERGEEKGGYPRLPVQKDGSRFARISEAVTGRPLVGGNGITMLHNGEQVYPAMLGAIADARQTIFLSSYIFENNRTGLQFVDALSEAAQRGVEVRVLIDGVGELYTLPRVGTLLKRKGVRMARFLPPKLFPPTFQINLRNHRKILAVDRCIAFVGGMNIGDRHLAENPENPKRVVDAHFHLTGPIVTQIEEVFLEDWTFSTGEEIHLDEVLPVEEGEAVCRLIADGPNEDLDKLATIFSGVVSSAQNRIQIMTPYFLPSGGLIAVLQAAALRGVEVVVVLPERSNLPFIDWATRNMLWELLQWGVRVHYQPPPFVHTKLLLIDDHYAQIGSANVDSRSHRLNFELVLEVYDAGFAKILNQHFQRAISCSKSACISELDNRSLPIRTRDALSWLFSPYL